MCAEKPDDGIGEFPDLPDIDFEIPDDLSELSSSEPLPLSVVVLPLTSVEAATAVAVLAGVAGVVAPVGKVAMLVLADASEKGTNEAAQLLSTALSGAELAVLRRAAGMVSAQWWATGEHLRDEPGGVVINMLPVDVEEVLVGTVVPADIRGALDTTSMSKTAAAASLVKSSRGKRKWRKK